MSNTRSVPSNYGRATNAPSWWRGGAPPAVILVVILLCTSLVPGCSSPYRIPDGRYPGFAGEINEHTRLIGAPPDAVFQILTRESLFRSICPEGTVVTHETTPPYRVGTVLRTRILHIFKLGWTTQVEEIDPGRMIRLRFRDGFFKGGTEMWHLDREGEKTRVTHTIIVSPRGVLRKTAWLLKVRRKHDRMVEAFLDNLKAVAEGKNRSEPPS